MPWPADVQDGNDILASHINAAYLASRSWGGPVVANGNNLTGVGTLAVNALSTIAAGPLQIAADGVVTVVNDLLIGNSAGDAGNKLRIDGYLNTLFLAANSAPGATQGTSITFMTAAAGGGESARLSILPDGQIAMFALPSVNPGAGTKRLWYDPADGNRVKFAS